MDRPRNAQEGLLGGSWKRLWGVSGRLGRAPPNVFVHNGGLVAVIRGADICVYSLFLPGGGGGGFEVSGRYGGTTWFVPLERPGAS